LIETQQKIQLAQERALTLRQQRESEANDLHREMLESEREGHKWFRQAFAKQHTYLAEELSLERQVNQRKGDQMQELFTMQSEHIKNLEDMRATAQKEFQAIRDAHFRAREVKSKQHEAALAAMRAQSLELETKLLTLNDSLQTRHSTVEEEAEKAPCVVM
jgi:ABC-type transporter lipoprotein component MlaA